ncbi:regulator of G protein signaling [Lyophyllum atratum]|nr:regulator of G protein signaling [Lyophyllum atratum]
MANVKFSDESKPAKPGENIVTKPHLTDNRGPGEHLLKMTRVGRPFHKDTADLFATFIIAIELKSHRLGFRTYPKSFSTEEAIQTLSSLKFSQSIRTPDPDDPSSFVTTTTNFMFSMTSPVAMNLAQNFMDARYIKNALDPSIGLFKDPSLYTLTPKGLHVLERFIHRTGIDADHLQDVLDTEIICSKLFRVERSLAEDEIIFSYSDILLLFRRFVGSQPNYSHKLPSSPEPLYQYTERSKGVALTDFTDRGLLGRGIQYQHCFDAVDALEWLCDFTSMVGRDEAAEVAAHFQRLGLIALAGNPDKAHKNAIIFTVSGSSPNGDPSIRSQGEFRCANKAMYQVTPKGRRVAGWVKGEENDSLAEDDSNDGFLDEKDFSEDMRLTPSEHLLYILKKQSFRSLFREYLVERFCEEHLLYWMDVEVINRKFCITSSVIGGTHALPAERNTATQVKADCMKHHQALVNKALAIYQTYLQPASEYELNTDYNLRNELVKFLETVATHTHSRDPRDMSNRILSCNADQLRMVIQHYKRIQTHTFRVMLTDSLPKFVQTEKYLALLQIDDYLDCKTLNDADSIIGGSGAYHTYSAPS